MYNLSDVLLLADVFENFRNICMDHYGLNPGWYFSAPGLAWDESGISEGIATISHCHAKTNNKYMEAEFDPSKYSKFISYLDVNNLYG